MQNLAHQHCSNHAAREAVARCPGCQQFFCRECVTEHDDRVVCAACLKKLARAPRVQRAALVKVMRFGQCVLGIMLAWFFFFLMAESLLRLPSSFHEATLWQVPWMEEK